MRNLIAIGLSVVTIVCALLAVYAFDQTVNPPRCGSQEALISCHGDLWYHLTSGIVFVVVAIFAGIIALAVVLRLRVVRG